MFGGGAMSEGTVTAPPAFASLLWRLVGEDGMRGERGKTFGKCVERTEEKR